MKYLIPLFFLLSCTEAQLTNDNSETEKVSSFSSLDPKEYFSNYKNSADLKNCVIKSLPTIGECKKLFKSPYGEIYFNKLDSLKKVFSEEILTSLCGFNRSSYDSETIDNGSAVFGCVRSEMTNTNEFNSWKKYYRDGIETYDVFFLKNEASSSQINGHEVNGLWLRTLVSLNDRWVIFPKIKRKYFEE
jgi:hypothetical protein